MDKEWIDCKHIFSNGTEFEIFEENCQRCTRYRNEHHEDGSLKWTWLECDGCGRRTLAYCYEYQATDLWNKGKAEMPESEG